MTGCIKSVLLNNVIKIELFNLKNICPLIYKCTDRNKYVLFDNYKLENNNMFMVGDISNRPLKLKHVYFKNGYNKYISLEEFVRKKYNIY
jgi:hypothetical protein